MLEVHGYIRKTHIFWFIALACVCIRCSPGPIQKGESSIEYPTEHPIDTKDSGPSTTPEKPVVCSSGTRPCKHSTSPCMGKQTCHNGQWQPCQAPDPVQEQCDGLDNDCDGQIDEHMQRSCYSGPHGTQGKGLCRAGQQTCTKGVWDTCSNQVLPKAKDLCNSGTDDNCDGTVRDPSTCSWIRFADGRSNKSGSLHPPHIQIASDGSLLLSGVCRRFRRFKFSDTLFGSVSSNTSFIYSMRLTRSGTFLWGTQISSAQQSNGLLPGMYSGGHAVDSTGNMYVFGSTSSVFQIEDKAEKPKGTFFFLYKYSPQGKVIWKHILFDSYGYRPPGFGNHEGKAMGVKVTSKGTLLIVGTFSGKLEVKQTSTPQVFESQNKNSDLFLAQVDPQTGSIDWIKSMGGPGQDSTVNTIQSTEQGHLLIAGQLNQPPGGFHNRPLKGPYPFQLEQKVLATTEGQQSFLLSFDLTGTLQWSKFTKGTGEVQVHNVLSTPEGIFVAGFARGDSQLFGSKSELYTSSGAWLSRLDSKGKSIWSVYSRSSASFRWKHLVQAPNGGIYAVGDLQGSATINGTTLTSKGKRSIVWVYFTKEGDVSQAHVIGNKTGEVFPTSIAVGEGQQIFLTGSWKGRIAFDDISSSSSSLYKSFFLWKMKQPKR